MATTKRVLMTDLPWGDARIEQEILTTIGADIVEAKDESEEALAELAANVDAIATCWAKVTAKVIEASPQCCIVARMGIGLDNIDVAAATRRRIPVTNVPDYCLSEVSDHALALLLACARKIGFFHSEIKGGKYDLQAAGPMHRLSQQTLGLIGFGRIAQALLPKARALGLRVVAYSPSGNDHGLGVPMVSLAELLETSDFISLHCPLNDETRHLISSDALTRMKPSAYIINTSRGGLIDSGALWDALQQSQIAGAGLDVFEQEPPDLNDPLLADPRVIATPHAAFVSVESLHDLRMRSAHQIVAALQGERPTNVVNPQIYQT